MYKSSIELIRHIEAEAGFILKHTKDKNFEQFYTDEVLKRAVIRALEIIGEASKKVDPDFKAKNEYIEWKYMAKMRDLLIHHYMGVDYSVVWKTITNDLPEMYFQIQKILEKNNGS